MIGDHTKVQLYDESTGRLCTFDIPQPLEAIADRLSGAHESEFLGKPCHGEAGHVGFCQVMSDKIVFWFYDGYQDEADSWIEVLENEELATA